MFIKPTFAFLDESGNLSPQSPVRYFAVGAIIDSFPDGLIRDFHLLFEGLCSALKKDPSHLEFKFSGATKSSLNFYLTMIDILEKYNSWRFCCFILDKADPAFSSPQTTQEVWECYLRFTKMLLRSNLLANERTVLLADFYRQPKGEVHKLATLPQVIPQLVDTLPVESQGVLPVQAADVLLGATLYDGKDKIKQAIAERVAELREKLSSWRFNVWAKKWQKKPQGSGV